MQPRHFEVPKSVFGERTSFTEEMGRLGLIFECFVEEGGVLVVAEFNRGCLEEQEMGAFVRAFERVLGRVLGMSGDEGVAGIELGL